MTSSKRISLCDRTGLALVACLCVAGCGSNDPGFTPPETDGTLELYSWWTNPGESDALKALLDVFSKKYPDTKITNAAVANISEAQAQLRDRMTERKPPDTFQ